MPTEDGSIVIRATIDDKDAEKKLKSLNSQIDRLEEKINKTQAKRSPLAEQALELGAALDAAKQKLYEMQSAGAGAHVSAAQLTAQKENVVALQAQYNAVQSQVERYDKQLKDANFDLEYAKQQAGELHRQLARTGPAAEKMAAAMDRAQKSAKRFGGRLREVLRSALIFTVISQGLASFRDWMGKVIRTNAEAQEAFARLKGALLTLAQPLVEVIIPALTAFVNGLTRIVTVVAQLVSRLFGKTISQSQEAAKGLYEETEALESVGGAAEEAAGSLAGFDEINTIQTENAGGSGVGAPSSDTVAPDFQLDGMLDESQLQKILDLVKLIGSALLAWKLSSALGLGLKGFLGLLLSIYSLITFIQNLFDAWTGGVTWDNFLGMLTSALGLAAGLGLAFGTVAAGISLIVTGLTMLVTGFHDAAENGWNLENLLTSIAGILLTGLGISVLTGSWIPLLIAGIASLLLAWTTATGHGEELIEGLKTAFQGFLDFFTNLFSGDIDSAIAALGDIFGGLKTAVGAVIDGVRDTFLSFLDWLDEKTGGRLSGIIDFFKGLFTTLFEDIKKNFGNIMDAVEEIFGGIVNFIAGVFTQDWDRAWEGVKSIFSGIWNGMISVLETAINFFIKGINWLIEKINTISFTVPDWVPLVGGKTVGIHIPLISEVSIPRLAAGTVVPPNREFMAMLGDNKTETEVVSPLSTIRQAMAEALEASGFGGGNIEVNLVVDGATLARVIVPKINDMTRSAGKPVLLI